MIVKVAAVALSLTVVAAGVATFALWRFVAGIDQAAGDWDE